MGTKIYQKCSAVSQYSGWRGLWGSRHLPTWPLHKEWPHFNMCKGRCFVSIWFPEGVYNPLRGIYLIRMDQLAHERHSQIMTFSCWEYSAHYFKMAKCRAIWEFKSDSYIRWQVYVRHTCTTTPFFQCICQRPKTLDHKNKLFCTLQCTEQQRKDTSWRVMQRHLVKGSYHSDVEGWEPGPHGLH